MSQYVLALDQGTTSSRAILFNQAAQPVAVAQQEFEQLFPHPGHVEHDPEAIWDSQSTVARQVLDDAGVSADAVASIGITNQRETTVLWERATGRPVANAIVWQSRQSADICDRLCEDGLEPLFRARTGLVVDAYFSGTKIRWLLDHVPGLQDRAERGELLFGTIDTFLLWRLTGGRVHVTDVSNASRTLLFNIHTREWDDELLAALRIPRSLLPEVRASSEVYGETDADLLGRSIPVGSLIGDQQAALFGQACSEPGTAKNTYGTGCFLLLNTGDSALEPPAGLLSTIGWEIDGQLTYCLEGSVFIGGAVVQWLRDGLGIISSADEVEALAASVPDSDGLVVVPAFTGLGAPHWDPDARGTVFGITRGTTKAHLARASLEAVAFQVRDLIGSMTGDDLTIRSLKVDGGGTRNDLLMQFQADLLSVPVQRAAVQETTALGAALLAGLATGFWSNRDEVNDLWALDREFAPGDVATAESTYARWRRGVQRSLGWESDN